MANINWNSPENKKLVQAILSLESAGEAENFLRDLLTEGEIKEFSKRLQTAEMLSKGVHYSAIEEKTGFSSTTVARVSRWLKNGKGGYKGILKKLPRSKF
ncbi:MAG: YerC/YecD family TrpR-related protein [Minisyncoccota bacterium]